MPTNISTPIWQCDICHTRFGSNRTTAQRCEDSGPPMVLPAGTAFLAHSSTAGSSSTGRRGFSLTTLTPTDRITTSTSASTPERPGRHHRDYAVAGQKYAVNDEHLFPGLPGFLQVRDRVAQRQPQRDPDTTLAPWAAKLFGLAQPGSPVATGRAAPAISWDTRAQWVKPLTPAIRAVFDALDVQLDLADLTRRQEFIAASYEVYQAGGYSRRAAAALALANPQTRIDAREDLLRAWICGADVIAPWPTLRTRSTRTASTLTKELRSLVEATGFPWEPRTTALQYVNTLIRKELPVSLDINMNLFPGTKVIAVAGVKGGVGKSTVAAALAAQLADTGHRVALVDLDVSGPSQHLLWGLGPVPANPDTMTISATATDVPGLSVFSTGQVAEGLPRRWDDTLTSEWIEFVGATLDVSETDIVVLDLPAGLGVTDQLVTGDGKAVQASTVVYVTTAHPLAIADVTRGLPVDMHARHRRVLVENMSRVSGTTDDGATAHVRLFGTPNTVKDLAERHHVTYGGSLPWASDPRALAATAEMASLAAALA